MITIRESLLGLTAYPVPCRTLESISAKRGLALDGEAVQEMLASREYRLAEADLYMWLYFAPNVSQGGQSYSLTDEQRKQYRSMARVIYNASGEANDKQSGVTYGYKGTRI